MNTLYYRIHFERIPALQFPILGLWKPLYIDLTTYDKPITWEQLEEEPADFENPSDGNWFSSLNLFTMEQLKRYMKDNNLGIAPGQTFDIALNSSFDEVVADHEFVKLGDPCVPFGEMAVLFVSAGAMTTAWIIFSRQTKKKGR